MRVISVRDASELASIIKTKPVRADLSHLILPASEKALEQEVRLACELVGRRFSSCTDFFRSTPVVQAIRNTLFSPDTRFLIFQHLLFFRIQEMGPAASI